MNWQIAVMIVFTLATAFDLTLTVLRMRSCARPIPENVKDIYDEETYTRWRAYTAEKSRLSVVSSLVQFVVMVVLLLSGAYAAFARLFPADPILQLTAVLLLQAVAETVASLPLNYIDTMRIEEKYGFNRSTKKTFYIDQVRGFIMNFALSAVLMYMFLLAHTALGDGVLILFTAGMLAFSLLITFLYPFFSRLGNKFTPLEEGELRTRLTEMLTSHGYRIRDIKVMDASRRTTRSNAYFTGFGATKTIVLYDTLLSSMTTDEICAVFAHELGHGLYRHTLKRQILSTLQMLLIGALIWLSVSVPAVYTAFGFDGVNYGFAYILLGTCLLPLFQPLFSVLFNYVSRLHEYQADRQAVKEGCGEALASGLKVLARENFSHLSPHPLLVALEYSHPPMHLRLKAIEDAQAQQTAE
ncbi:MAG: M48 family metallopeptidase [Clostridiales bacterium]|nr:M48 family metallopeptidase [Clostridiales bacterium]